MALTVVVLWSLAGCTQYQQNAWIDDDVCQLDEEQLRESGMTRQRVTGAPNASGDGAGRGSQRIAVTCPDGTTIVMTQDIEGRGGGTVSP